MPTAAHVRAFYLPPHPPHTCALTHMRTHSLLFSYDSHPYFGCNKFKDKHFAHGFKYSYASSCDRFCMLQYLYCQASVQRYWTVYLMCRGPCIISIIILIYFQQDAKLHGLFIYFWTTALHVSGGISTHR